MCVAHWSINLVKSRVPCTQNYTSPGLDPYWYNIRRSWFLGYPVPQLHFAWVYPWVSQLQRPPGPSPHRGICSEGDISIYHFPHGGYRFWNWFPPKGNNFAKKVIPPPHRGIVSIDFGVFSFANKLWDHNSGPLNILWEGLREPILQVCNVV